MVGAVLRHIGLAEDIPGNSLHALIGPGDAGYLALHRLISPFRYLDALSSRGAVAPSPENALVCSVARRAILGVTVAIIREDLLHDLGLEFAIRALGDLGQIKVLDRIAVNVEFEAAAQRGEVRLLQCRRHRFLVAEVAPDRLD